MAKGSCSCGAVSFEYSGEPAATAACHCLACRKSSGNTHSINIIIPSSSLSITGDSSLNTWKRKGESGKDVTNSFCSSCGNLLFVDVAQMEGMTIVKYGLVDDVQVLERLAPKKEIYCRNLLGWEKGLPTTEKVDGT